jgi:hypothetical protein
LGPVRYIGESKERAAFPKEAGIDSRILRESDSSVCELVKLSVDRFGGVKAIRQWHWFTNT